MHFLYYCFPLQNWSADEILLKGNTGVDDVFIPQCGINVFVDRCELKKTPYTYFLRYAALYFGRTFFCIKEGNHELIRRLYAKLMPECSFHFHAPASHVEGQPGRFFVCLESGSKLGPFHQVVLACPPHQAPSMMPSDANYDLHRDVCAQFGHVVARSCVHSDPSPFEKAEDHELELGVMYERSTGSEQHHYLHINPAQFYNIAGLPKNSFVTVSYGDAHPNDVVATENTTAYYDSTLSRLKVSAQKKLPALLKQVNGTPAGIHLCSAAQLGLMWHEDGLMMAHRAYEAAVRGLHSASSSLLPEDSMADASKCDSKDDGDNSSTSIGTSDRQSESSAESFAPETYRPENSCTDEVV